MSTTTIRIQATEAQLQAFQQQCEVTELMLASTLCRKFQIPTTQENLGIVAGWMSTARSMGIANHLTSGIKMEHLESQASEILPPVQEAIKTGLTTDPTDPRLHQVGKDGQNEAYIVLSEEERAKGFVRPVRRSYVHQACGALTTMGSALAETYARDPKFYGSTFCTGCRSHFPVEEFTWDGTNERVGS